MGSSKNRSNRTKLLAILLVLIIGIGIGALIDNIPYITFNNEIDLGVCIAVLGLLGSIFYIPYIVERNFTKLDNINEVILNDLESIHKEVELLKAIYVSVKPNAVIKEATYMQILAAFKTISSSILALNSQLHLHKRLVDFKQEVYNDRFLVAKDACTENLIIGKNMDARTTLDAMTELNNLCAVLKDYRYKTYQDK